MKTHLQTRTFLLCFIPMAILLTSVFWLQQRFIDTTVREGLQTSLRERQTALAASHARAELQNSRFLKVAGENSALKAGIELLLSNRRNQDARHTVEDQLRELGEHMGFDYMRVATPDGGTLAAVSRQSSAPGAQLVPLAASVREPPSAAIVCIGNRLLQVASVPVDRADENIAVLSVGAFFDFPAGNTPAILVHNGRVVQSNLTRIPRVEMEQVLTRCDIQSECELRLAGSRWIVLPMQAYGEGYTLLSVENIDAATAPIEGRLRKVFVAVIALFILLALLCSYGVSRSIVKPIAEIVNHLRGAVRTGKLSRIGHRDSAIVEIDELAEIYNCAASSVQQAGDRLESAYLQFVRSLAQALDARDPYTAGHSLRVSQLSCAVAAVLNLPADSIERIRIGALLHDIGKIGVPDHVLQKSSRLTEEEFGLVKQHPVIGRRILEAVQGFAPYLAAVELHHENWNGSGYPHEQRGEETPIEARIIHIADAFDAMTSDRSYRTGITPDKAAAELKKFAGSQFDPSIVEVFLKLPQEILGQPQSGNEVGFTAQHGEVMAPQ